jgi:hypothetical protein
MFLLEARAMVRATRFTMENAFLRPFPNYDGVPLVSIAILLRPELRVTDGEQTVTVLETIPFRDAPLRRVYACCS